MEEKSYFDGGLLGLIGISLVGILITVGTFGICLPWAVCVREDWIAKHTVINGRRLKFEGSAIGLFGTWIKIFLLTIVTFGIYGFWANIEIKKWVTKNTCFAL